MVEQVYDRAGGVPLFVEEFTKMVQESVVLDQAGQGDAGSKAWLRREIPATLQDLVMARLDRMEGERDVAQLAATLGREFSYELLAAVASVDEPTLQAELAKLVQAEILYPKGRIPRCTYIFKHALVEDALYNALVKGKRQQFHGRIAEVLEARFPQTTATQPELVAHHFTEAGLAEAAIGYWLKAGLRSRRTIGGERSDRPPDPGAGAARGARRVTRAGRSRIGTVESRWAPPTSHPAVMPRRRSARFSAGRACCASGSGSHRSSSRSSWASGSGISSAARSGCVRSWSPRRWNLPGP